MITTCSLCSPGRLAACAFCDGCPAHIQNAVRAHYANRRLERAARRTQYTLDLNPPESTTTGCTGGSQP